MKYNNVQLGKDVIIEKSAIVGKPPRGKKDGELKTIIGDNSIIREFTVIYAGSKLGKNCQTGHNALIREENEIGDNVSIGTNATLEPRNKIGNNVRIHSGCFLEDVKVEDNVFIGPNVVFVDDLHPPCPRFEECIGGAVVRKNAVIGSNSTILPGIKIGANSLIGAGSVVTKDVPPSSVVIGNPARVIKKIEELKCFKGFYKRPYEWREK